MLERNFATEFFNISLVLGFIGTCDQPGYKELMSVIVDIAGFQCIGIVSG